jgi:hypothetical protein
LINGLISGARVPSSDDPSAENPREFSALYPNCDLMNRGVFVTVMLLLSGACDGDAIDVTGLMNSV